MGIAGANGALPSDGNRPTGSTSDSRAAEGPAGPTQSSRTELESQAAAAETPSLSLADLNLELDHRDIAGRSEDLPGYILADTTAFRAVAQGERTLTDDTLGPIKAGLKAKASALQDFYPSLFEQAQPTRELVFYYVDHGSHGSNSKPDAEQFQSLKAYAGYVAQRLEEIKTQIEAGDMSEIEMSDGHNLNAQLFIEDGNFTYKSDRAVIGFARLFEEALSYRPNELTGDEAVFSREIYQDIEKGLYCHESFDLAQDEHIAKGFAPLDEQNTETYISMQRDGAEDLAYSFDCNYLADQVNSITATVSEDDPELNIRYWRRPDLSSIEFATDWATNEGDDPRTTFILS